jgi:hypothetical protein
MRRRQFLQTAFCSVPLISFPTLSSGISPDLLSTETELLVLKSPSEKDSARHSEASVWYTDLDKDIYVCVATESPHVKAILRNENKMDLAFRRISRTSAQTSITSSSIEAFGSIERNRVTIDRTIVALQQRYQPYWSRFGETVASDIRNGKKIIVRYQISVT